MVYKMVWCGAPPCRAAGRTSPSFCPNAKLRNRNLKQPPMPLQHRCLAAEPPLTGSSDESAAGASDGGCLGPDPTLALRQRAVGQQPAGAALPLSRTTTMKTLLPRDTVSNTRVHSSRTYDFQRLETNDHVAGFSLPRSLRCTSPNIRLLGDCAPPRASKGARVAWLLLEADLQLGHDEARESSLPPGPRTAPGAEPSQPLAETVAPSTPPRCTSEPAHAAPSERVFLPTPRNEARGASTEPPCRRVRQHPRVAHVSRQRCHRRHPGLLRPTRRRVAM